jgi:hypothetical protein
MRAEWHRYKHGWGYEHVLFVGVWEWRVSAIPGDWQMERVFGVAARWRATGPGLDGGNPTSPGTALTETLPQAKRRCEDAALRCLEACAKDIGMKVVPA